jgi:hypothetical protein
MSDLIEANKPTEQSPEVITTHRETVEEIAQRTNGKQEVKEYIAAILINQENTHLCKHCGKLKNEHIQKVSDRTVVFDCPSPQPGVLSVDEVPVVSPGTTWEVGETIGLRYFKTTWYFTTEPFTLVPVYLESFNRITKKFTIVVLHDKRKLDTVPVGYPLIPITEQEAQDLVEHRRSKNASTTNKQTTTMELSNLNVAPTEHKHHNTPATHEKEVAPAEPTPATPVAQATPTKKERKKVDRGDRPSIRGMVLTGIGEGKSKEELIPLIQSVYPEKSEKDIKGLISISIHSAKAQEAKKAAKAGATPVIVVPAEPTTE